jgi:predicted restriction endonuclease
LQAAAAADPTVREALVKQRRGQDKYREALEKLWSGRCPITGINHPAFLVASHAKPWADSDPTERLDPFNGILLAVHIDRLFDGGWISFTDSGQILLSPALPSDIAVSLLGQGCQERAITQFTPKHSPYLAWHRDKVFLKG